MCAPLLLLPKQVWGGILGLINAELHARGKSPLGFANPTLYAVYAAHPGAFIDITSGGNTCTQDVCNCSPGFQATTGWGAAHLTRPFARVSCCSAVQL